MPKKSLLFFLVFAKVPFLFGQIYSNHNFFAHNHKSNVISGSNDCSASLTLQVVKNKLEVDIYVTDDEYIVKNQIDQSDHVEIWISAVDMPSEYVFKNDGKVMMANDEFLELDTLRKDKEYKSIIESKAKEGNDFSGLQHWSISENQLILENEEDYHLLPYPERAINYIHKEFIKTELGYHVHLVFEPQALHLVRDVNKEIAITVNVYDVDKGTEASLISTAGNRKWGDRRTLRSVQLNKPITIQSDLMHQAKLFHMANVYWHWQQDEWVPVVLDFEYETEFGDFYDPYFTNLIDTSMTYTHNGILVKESISASFSSGYAMYREHSIEIDDFIVTTAYNSFGSEKIKIGENVSKDSEILRDIYITPEHDTIIFIETVGIANAWGSGNCGSCDLYYLELYNKSNSKNILSFVYNQESNYVDVFSGQEHIQINNVQSKKTEASKNNNIQYISTQSGLSPIELEWQPGRRAVLRSVVQEEAKAQEPVLYHITFDGNWKAQIIRKN